MNVTVRGKKKKERPKDEALQLWAPDVSSPQGELKES